MKVLLSIGGYTYSPAFALPLSSSATRANFVNSSIALVENYGLDGLDIDFEYPANKQQAMDYVSLLRELREGLDQLARTRGEGVEGGFELTVAAPCGPQNYQIMCIREMDQSVLLHFRLELELIFDFVQVSLLLESHGVRTTSL